MRDLTKGYESPKTLIDRLVASGMTKKSIAEQIGLSNWAVCKIAKNDTETASIHWYKLKQLAGKK